RESGDRWLPRAACFGVPGPSRRPASGRTDGTARRNDRIDTAGATGRTSRCGAGRPDRDPHRSVPGGSDLSIERARPRESRRMRYEIDLFGVLVPSFLLWTVVAYVLARIASKFLARTGLYRQVWHPPLFDFALLICLLTSLVFISREFVS